jgi:hypothetical protein
MPVHDWTKVDAGTFHSFHNAWITHLMGMLNDGVLPRGYYALSELYSSRLIPGTSPSVTAEPTLTIRRAGGRRIVAFLEILSTGTKDSEAGLQELVNKIDAALVRGIHAMVVELFPPGRFDPQGLHGAVWTRYGNEGCVIPPA